MMKKKKKKISVAYVLATLAWAISWDVQLDKLKRNSCNIEWGYLNHEKDTSIKYEKYDTKGVSMVRH